MTQKTDAPTLCHLCRGHGWMQLTHDPDVDIDCPACGGTGKQTDGGQ